MLFSMLICSGYSRLYKPKLYIMEAYVRLSQYHRLLLLCSKQLIDDFFCYGLYYICLICCLYLCTKLIGKSFPWSCGGCLKKNLLKSTDIFAIWSTKSFQYQLSSHLGFVCCHRKVNYEQKFLDAVRLGVCTYDGYWSISCHQRK